MSRPETTSKFAFAVVSDDGALHLQGLGLLLARMGWIAVVVPTYALFVVTIPSYFISLHHLHPSSAQSFTVLLTPGDVHMLLRSSAGFICRSDSNDYGITWSSVYLTALPNPNSGIDLAKLATNDLVLIFNPQAENWGERRPLSVAISRDNGHTWDFICELETGVEGDEFSYPAVVSRQNTIALTYTWKRRNIAFWIGTIE